MDSPFAANEAKYEATGCPRCIVLSMATNAVVERVAIFDDSLSVHPRFGLVLMSVNARLNSIQSGQPPDAEFVFHVVMVANLHNELTITTCDESLMLP